MCGIIGYCGPKPAAGVLLEGLKRLEYRGYDSAGICVQTGDGALRLYKRKGKIRDLIPLVPEGLAGSCGIGHTRWATHGEVNDQNAHPHLDCERPHRRGPQRDHRELPESQGEAPLGGAPLRLGDRLRGHRPPDREILRRRLDGGGAPGAGPAEGHLRHRVPAPRPPRPPGGGPSGLAPGGRDRSQGSPSWPPTSPPSSATPSRWSTWRTASWSASPARSCAPRT